MPRGEDLSRERGGFAEWLDGPGRPVCHVKRMAKVSENIAIVWLEPIRLLVYRCGFGKFALIAQGVPQVAMSLDKKRSNRNRGRSVCSALVKSCLTA